MPNLVNRDKLKLMMSYQKDRGCEGDECDEISRMKPQKTLKLSPVCIKVANKEGLNMQQEIKPKISQTLAERPPSLTQNTSKNITRQAFKSKRD